MKPDLKASLLGGFLGTLALTAMMRVVAPKMGVHMDIAALLGTMMGTSRALGLLTHFALGTVVFSLAYGLLAYRFLPGPPIVKGALFGVALWIGMQVVAMPMMGGGLFGERFGGMKTAVAALVAHLVFGMVLGSIASVPLRSREARAGGPA
jgi:uncharacterized membrane protein YagU involved in acid resistance